VDDDDDDNDNKNDDNNNNDNNIKTTKTPNRQSQLKRSELVFGRRLV
jgi:hypothetical protein